LKRWNKVAEAKTPDGRTLALVEHDGDYVLRIDGAELMSTRRFASEEALAERVCAPAAGRQGTRVLVGGLGFGFTLRAALRVLPPDAEVVVAELVPEIVAWNRNPAYGLAAAALADPRAKVELKSVEGLLMLPGSRYNGIMLDVDNGPDELVSGGNARLYQEQGLHLARGALRPGGRLGVWSAAADPGFAKLMGRCGFGVTVERVRAHKSSGGWHTLFLGEVVD
jgi:spermidine synthase